MRQKKLYSDAKLISNIQFRIFKSYTRALWWSEVNRVFFLLTLWKHSLSLTLPTSFALVCNKTFAIFKTPPHPYTHYNYSKYFKQIQNGCFFSCRFDWFLCQQNSTFVQSAEKNPPSCLGNVNNFPLVLAPADWSKGQRIFSSIWIYFTFSRKNFCFLSVPNNIPSTYRCNRKE